MFLLGGAPDDSRKQRSDVPAPDFAVYLLSGGPGSEVSLYRWVQWRDFRLPDFADFWRIGPVGRITQIGHKWAAQSDDPQAGVPAGDPVREDRIQARNASAASATLLARSDAKKSKSCWAPGSSAYTTG